VCNISVKVDTLKNCLSWRYEMNKKFRDPQHCIHSSNYFYPGVFQCDRI
jgi:hypothetical protein